MPPELPAPAWGIAARSGLWPVTIKILFVIDGRITLSKTDYDFGLGYVLDSLRSVWSWWIRFDIDVATREEAISSSALGSNTVRYVNFRFTSADFDIDWYDQIWFFGDQPSANDGDDLTTDADILPPYTLDDDELKRIAAWMDRGGGVFATGDHGVLGASLCSRIPRVRTMRRWTRSQQVPSLNGVRRHQTLQGGSDYLGEGDTHLQPVEVVQWPTANKLPFLPQFRPHPVMCSNWGIIDRFPDHMHEGDLVVDDLVELDRPLGIPGHDKPEYPYPIPEVLALGLTDIGPFRWRPRPQIIAYGRTTNPHFPEELGPAVSFLDAGAPVGVGTKRFGLVSVYDGNPADVGRVVCDATWHHWFSMNLEGIVTQDVHAYRKMQAYYRNVGLWLASESQRRSMLVSATWGALIGSSPGFFTREQNVWEMGERAVSVLDNTMSPCWIDEVVASFLDLQARSLQLLPPGLPSAPQWSGLPVDLVNRAVVGSMCASLVDLASEHRRAAGKYDEVSVPPERITSLAMESVRQARELISETLGDAAKAFSRLRDAFTGGDAANA